MRINFSQGPYEIYCLRKDSQKNSILIDLAKTKAALDTAYAGFDNATDPDLIDCYIYEVNSVLKRYKYLLEQAAKVNLLPDNELYSESPVCSLIG